MPNERIATRRTRISQRASRLSCVVLVALCAVASHAQEPLQRTPAPEGAKLYFIGIADGDEVTSPVLVRFGLSGMGVAPAGVEKPDTGHHHLLIDSELTDPGLPVPNDATHRHFGGGQTEVSVELSPGRHTLQLLLADFRHVPHEPPITSERISITVK